jgi:hypothetical protein
MRRKRATNDRGAVMIVMAGGLVGLVALAGLALDGGRAYGERRQMQNAADAASMAATRELARIITGETTDASLIRAAALDAADENGADLSEVTCTLVDFERVAIEACPTGSTLSQPATDYSGVLVETEQTQDTFFMKAVGHSSFTAAADATAQVGQVGGSFVAPFVFCGTAPGHSPQVLVVDSDPESETGFKVNDLAVGSVYSVYGNDIKNNGRDCGNPSSSFRGNADTSQEYQIPGEWDTTTGNKNGPTLRLVNSGNACSPDFTNSCVFVMPLCPFGNGQGGNNFRIYCTHLGLFEVTHVANHDIDARFLGGTTLNQGGIIGPADPNGSNIVALTD